MPRCDMARYKSFYIWHRGDLDLDDLSELGLEELERRLAEHGVELNMVGGGSDDDEDDDDDDEGGGWQIVIDLDDADDGGGGGGGEDEDGESDGDWRSRK